MKTITSLAQRELQDEATRFDYLSEAFGGQLDLAQEGRYYCAFEEEEHREAEARADQDGISVEDAKAILWAEHRARVQGRSVEEILLEDAKKKAELESFDWEHAAETAFDDCPF